MSERSFNKHEKSLESEVVRSFLALDTLDPNIFR